MGKIKVLQIIPSFGIGGAEKLVLDYLTYFDDNSVEIMAISLYCKKNNMYDKFIEENGLKVIYLDKKKGIDLTMMKKLNNIIKKYKPDIIHSHMNTIKYLIYSIRKHRNIVLFHTIHSEPKRDVNLFDKFFNKLAFTKFNCTPIALTENLKRKVNKFYNIEHTIFLNNGVDLDKIRKLEEKKIDIRKDLRLKSDSFLIGHIGRFSNTKNHDFIIEVFYEYKKLNNAAILLLVGDGNLRKSIESKVEKLNIQESVLFLGHRNDIAQILNSLDLFLFPSFYEGFPITLIEAQAVKPSLKCIISDTIDQSCILNKNTHVMSLSESSYQWALAISNFKYYSGEEKAIDKFDINYVVKNLENIYINKINDLNCY